MSEDWDSVAADVALGLLEAGTTAYIVRAGTPTGPAHNPTPGTPSDLAVTVVYDKFRNNEIDGTLIKAGDLKILVAAGSVVPTVADGFKDGDGNQYTIINVTPLKPGGVVVMWEIQARG